MNGEIVLAVLVSLLSVTAVVDGQQGSPLPENPNLLIDPKRQVILPQVGYVRLSCNSAVPLRNCTFVLPNGEVLDFSLGHNSTKTKIYNYYGLGLENGDCGLDFFGWRRLYKWSTLVECRIRTTQSDTWESNAGTARVTGFAKQVLPVFEISPQTADLETGDDITITCNAAGPIEFCHFYLPGGRNLTFDLGPESESTSEYRYHGAGLQSGECGVTLTGVDERLNGYVVCKLGKRPDEEDGAWEIDAMKIRTVDTECPALTAAPTVVISCEQQGNLIECAQPQEIGTVAVVRCKPGHITDPPGITYNEIKCLPGAKWDHPVFNCIPGCGRRNANAGALLVSGGEKSKPGEFPWHIGVYQVMGGTQGIVQICGGTLITTSIVLSAAHCFWDEQKRRKNSPREYKVAAGKQLRLWDDPDPNVQRRDVAAIVLPHRYNGRTTNFASDIALLRVSVPFDVTDRVGFICMDWDGALEDQQLAGGNRGIVAGWGYTENQVQSDALKYAELPYVPLDACNTALPSELQALLTHDKFCAGFFNRSVSVCGGDSGGGLVFLDEVTNTYYIRGVVSIAFTPADFSSLCYNQQYTGFTRVSRFTSWIRKNT